MKIMTAFWIKPDLFLKNSDLLLITRRRWMVHKSRVFALTNNYKQLSSYMFSLSDEQENVISNSKPSKGSSG